MPKENYCIELNPEDKGEAIDILKNDEIVDTTPAFDEFVASHLTCFDSFDLEHDIFELRNGGVDGVSLAINLINGDVSTSLKFGFNGDLTKITIDGNQLYCRGDAEAASAIRIQNGNVIDSECIGELSINEKSNFFHLEDILVAVICIKI